MKRLAVIVTMLVLASLVLLPFLWTAATSFKPLTEVNKHPPEWFSPNMSLEPYRDMFFYLPFSSYTVNSLVVAGAATALTLAMGSLAGFAFARFKFPGKRLVLLILLLSQMLPGASVIIP
ncbi:carbohydrate ABC transporter permease, partial [bacterium]